MKMEAVWPSEILVSYYITIWHHNSEDCDLNQQHKHVRIPADSESNLYGMCS